MEVLRRCPLAIAQRLVHCAIALSTAVLDRVTKTMSVAPLLTNNLDNSKQKTSNLLSPAPPPYSWSLLGKSEGPAPPPSSKISWSFDLAWNPQLWAWTCIYIGPWLWSQLGKKPRRQSSAEGNTHTPNRIAFRHLPWRKDVVNQCLESGEYYVLSATRVRARTIAPTPLPLPSLSPLHPYCIDTYVYLP